MTGATGRRCSSSVRAPASMRASSKRSSTSSERMSYLLAEDRDILAGVAETVLERLEHRLHVGERRAQVVARPGDQLAPRVEEATEICAHLVE